MAKRVIRTSGYQLRTDQREKLQQLLSAKDSSGRPKMSDPAYAADVRQAIANVTGDGPHVEEVELVDGIHDIDRKITALTGLEELQKEQAKTEVERFIKS